ncbi:hypothetical protein [Pedobacter heparinus]|uniref:HNH nuclease domain-containing protein n=1 Tax=Pedobacter heparinus (strain ATCC 13125 / DSM 2366 / CIP 104194 / JCM 7457 / NBRC 12017 / NCIMB 9290 / NRRL B-14731 / HIM 762-3) TaxID=485917 RepID=C6Y2T6_PEDHD|nr:hypothetical protein [Pedobacter heparinus]ACU03149.1 hypothetical protein Phep_0927 [Pedobacter heparinus DSM 2366]
MNRIILQPAANKPSQENYKNTVINSVSIASIVKYIRPEQEAELRQLYPSGELRVWGVDRDAKGRSTKVNDWNRITKGDIGLFAKDKFVYAAATVTTKFQNEALAVFLWGYKEPGITWEYLYFLDELRPLNIPYASLNGVIPKGKIKDNKFYEPNKNIQGFQVLSDLQSEYVFAAFADLESETYFDDTITGNRDATIARLNNLDGTDKNQVTKARKEQRILKEWLFGKRKYAICGICNKEYPVSLLVVAHIKKRSKSSHEERINLDIVMPMCKMGCDELYEQGYIGVKDGKVVAIKQPYTTAAIKTLTESLKGNTCTHYNDQTKGYFEWQLKENKFQ